MRLRRGRRRPVAALESSAGADAPGATVETVTRAYVTRERTFWGDYEWRCAAGQVQRPVGCERHADHYWCVTCEGFYGVPHDGIHEGPNAHPYGYSLRDQCACRPCKIATGRE